MKVYVVYSEFFRSVVGVYDDPEVAEKVRLVSHSTRVIVRDLNHIHPGHLESAKELGINLKG